MNRRLEGANSVCDGSVEEEDGCKGLWRVVQKKEGMLQRRSRWRKSNLQRRICSAETMEKQRERGNRGRAILTHISITMQCQWSVCEVCCCLVTVLQQQYQCVFMCVILTVVGVCTTPPLLPPCLLPPCLLPLLTRNALTRACSCRSLDGAATQSAPDARYCREASWCRGVDSAPRMNRVHWPRCPAVTPPINHGW